MEGGGGVGGKICVQDISESIWVMAIYICQTYLEWWVYYLINIWKTKQKQKKKKNTQINFKSNIPFQVPCVGTSI